MPTKKPSAAVIARAKKIRVLLCDADGTLTDGRVWLLSMPDGTAQEIKGFNAHDGAGMTMARAVGLRTGVITGRDSAAMARRAREMGMEFVYQKRAEKIPILEEILRIAAVTDAEVAYIGDDMPDIPVMKRAGLAIAVANAAPEVKRVAHYITSRAGGAGGVREAIELILKAQGKWLEAIAKAKA